MQCVYKVRVVRPTARTLPPQHGHERTWWWWDALVLQRNLRKTTARRTLKTWSLSPGGLINIQGHLTGNSIPWSWFQWSSRTGGRRIRVRVLTGSTVLFFFFFNKEKIIFYQACLETTQNTIIDAASLQIMQAALIDNVYSTCWYCKSTNLRLKTHFGPIKFSSCAAAACILYCHTESCKTKIRLQQIFGQTRPGRK